MREQFSLANIYKLAWPAIISHATVMFVGVIDLAFIAKLPISVVGVAAAAIANNVCGAIYAFLEGLRTGTTILVSQFFGADETKKIPSILNLALHYALMISIILLIATPFISIAVYNIVNGKLKAVGCPYLNLRLMGLPFHLTIFAIIGLFRGLKNTVIPMLITVVIALINMGLNYVLMYGMFGIPPMGMNGVALGSAFSYAIVALICFILIYKLPLTKNHVNFKAPIKPFKRMFAKLGTEIGIYSGIIVVALFMFVVLFIPLGEQIIAAHQIAFQVFMLTYLPPMGFFVAASIIISKLLGEKEPHHIVPATIKIWFASLPLIGTITIATAIFAPSIAHFFSPLDKTVAKLATTSIYQICVIQVLCSVFAVLKGSLSAVKDTRFVLVAGTLTSYIFFIPLAYILGIRLGYGIWGGYLAFILWTLLDNIIFGFRFFVTKPWEKEK